MGMCSTVYRPQVHLIAAKDAIKKAMTVYENVVCHLSSFCVIGWDNIIEYLTLEPSHVIVWSWRIKRDVNCVQHFWEVLEGGEGRTQWALDKMGLGTIAQEKAVVLSMGQVFGEIISLFYLLSKNILIYMGIFPIQISFEA